MITHHADKTNMNVSLPDPPVKCGPAKIGKVSVGDYYLSDGEWVLCNRDITPYYLHCTPIPPVVYPEIKHPLLRPGVWISIDSDDYDEGMMWVSVNKPEVNDCDKTKIFILGGSWAMRTTAIAINQSHDVPFIAKVI